MSDVPDDAVVAQPLGNGPLGPEGADLTIAEWASPAEERLWIAPLHIHHDSDEVWYVLDGTMILHLDGQEHRLGPGDCGMAVRGTAHSYRNAGPGSLRYVLVMSRRIADLIGALHDGPHDQARLEGLFREYGSTYLGWLPAPA